MLFYTQNGKERPVRLCESTRQFAYDSLSRKYGKDTLKVESVPLEHIEGIAYWTQIEQYDRIIREIAENAPIRICDGEKLSGAATLGYAIVHRVPAKYKEYTVFSSISHLTVDFETVLRYGVNFINEKAEKAYEQYKGTENEPFSKSCLNCLEAFELWHGRYLIELENREEYKSNYQQYFSHS